MLSNLKQIVKKNESDIFLTLVIVFVALTSFGFGLLIDFSSSNPIVIQNPTASVGQSLIDEEKPLKEEGIDNKGKFLGSINSNKYHHPDCPWAKKISEENRIWFDSENNAQEAGYIPCGNIGKY